jgi:hypothetical protein
MGSFENSKFFDPLAADQIRTTYNEIIDVLEKHDLLTPDLQGRELQAAIIRRLIKLFSDGTPHQYWKLKVLRTLPLR